MGGQEGGSGIVRLDRSNTVEFVMGDGVAEEGDVGGMREEETVNVAAARRARCDDICIIIV